MTRLAIIGGGISGLTVAYAIEQLESEGLLVDIDLYEATNVTGGVIQTARYNEWPVELGPDSLVDRQRGAVELCRRIGLERRLVGIRASAKPPLIRKAGGFTPFPHSEIRSYTLAGGLDQLAQALVQSLHRTALYLHWPVDKIFQNEDGWYLNGRAGPYQGLMLAVPASALTGLLSDVNVDVSWAKHIEYHPRAVVAAVYSHESFVDRSLLAHTGLIVSADTGLGLTALTWLSTKWDYYPEKGPIVCRSFWGPPGPNPDQWLDDEIQAMHESAVSKLAGPHEPPRWTKVVRHHTALPRVPDDLAWHYPQNGPANAFYLGFLGPYREGPGVSDCVRLAWEEAYRYAQWVKTLEN